jgi:hypothetical protein
MAARIFTSTWSDVCTVNHAGSTAPLVNHCCCSATMGCQPCCGELLDSPHSWHNPLRVIHTCALLQLDICNLAWLQLFEKQSCSPLISHATQQTQAQVHKHHQCIGIVSYDQLNHCVLASFLLEWSAESSSHVQYQAKGVQLR